METYMSNRMSEYSDELYHWGIKGMKWGVRRYQNADGTLTAVGQKRYEQDQRNNAGKKKGNKIGQADPDRWVREDMDRSNRVINDGARLSRDLKTVMDKSIKNTPKTRLDLSDMSDQELRNRINRELLERQYNDVFNPAQVSKGKERVSKILETAGDTLMVAGSAVTLAIGVRTLMKGA